MTWRSHAKVNAAINTLRKMGSVVTVFVFDTETTGLTKKDQIIQFSGVEYKISTPDMRVEAGQAYDVLICPDVEINPCATAAHGFTREDLLECSDERVVGPHILDLLARQDIIAGYNVQFDIRMVDQLKERLGASSTFTDKCIDVLEIARDIISADKVPDYKLGTIANHVCDVDGIKFHSAIDDVMATGKVLEYCLQAALRPASNEDLVTYNVQYAYYYENPRQRSQKRIKLMLYGFQKTASWNPFGAIYWDCVKHCWASRKDTKSKRIFKDADMNCIEQQMLSKYRFSSMDALAKAWMKRKTT